MNNTEQTEVKQEQTEVQPLADNERRIRPLSECDDSAAIRRHEQEKFKDKVHWYACYVTPQHELQVHDYLMGVEEQRKAIRRGKPKEEDLIIRVDPDKVKLESYVPLQRVRVKLSDRMVWKDKILIPGVIFVHCSINNREALFYGKMKEYVMGFMSDHDKHRPQPIPDDQMESFRALADSKYAFQMDVPTFKIGQSVLITAGPMAGHVAELISTKEEISKTEYQHDRNGSLILDAEGNPIPKHSVKLCVRLTDMLCAKFQLDAADVRVVPKGTKTELPLD